jgi:hypothetical protein
MHELLAIIDDELASAARTLNPSREAGLAFGTDHQGVYLLGLDDS